MIALLDVNVLVALAWPNHIHHQRAARWFETQHTRGWATCPLTESGFIRVSSNARVVPEARSPREAIELLRRLSEMGKHVFWTDDISISRSKLVESDKIMGYQQVTDAHLVALAIRRKGLLATFDGGVAEVVPRSVKPLDVVLVLS